MLKIYSFLLNLKASKFNLSLSMGKKKEAMLRSEKKKTLFPLLSLILVILLALTIIFTEISFHHLRSESHFIYVQPILDTALISGAFRIPPNSSVSLPHYPDSEYLDRFSRCNSTIKDTGKRVFLTQADVSKGTSSSCDPFDGKWVFDNISYPLYKESLCPYMSDQLACRKHGRNDLDYQFWRWQPKRCNLKNWNAVEILEILRGKRLMFVGDSLNRGQWISMVCLVQSAITEGKKSMTPNAALTVFKAEEYNATIEFLWAPLLVDSNSDDPDSIAKHARHMDQADILVFNTYLWWRQGPVKLMWSGENSACEEAEGIVAMEIALATWGNWIKKSKGKRVFFVTMSPTHMWRREWEEGIAGNCFGEKEPIKREGYWGSGSDMETMRMVEKTMGKLGPQVTVINITQLSEYRKDGHPSIYRKFWESFSDEQLGNPSAYSDCIHWCLPGVPDVWNQLLFHLL